MDPYEDTHSDSGPGDDVTAPGSLSNPPPYSSSYLNDGFYNPSLSATTSQSPPVIQMGYNYLTGLNHNSTLSQATSSQDGGDDMASSHNSAIPFPVLDPGLSFRSRMSQQFSVGPQTPNPYPAPSTPPSCQVSVIVPSPDLRPSPLQSQHPEDTYPDLECSICFSQFNNVFRCPKMLQCKHTFCLECLARINVKSVQPSAIQCPLCRSLTPLPTLGLPRLATDSNVLSYLPAAMQRVYSIRFLRNKGKLQVKRSSDNQHWWGHRSLASMRLENRSLNVGLPSPSPRGSSEADGISGALFRLTGRPACRAFLLTSVVMMTLLLTGIIIFLLILRNNSE